MALEQVASAYAGAARIALKWPNDLLLDGAKLSGILLERHGDAIVIGFGVNLAHHPEGLDRPAISLAAAGLIPSPDPALFVEDLAASFSAWLSRWRGEGLAPIRNRWLERAHPAGTPLVARTADGAETKGLFGGLDADGALLLRTGEGTQTIHAADVFLL